MLQMALNKWIMTLDLMEQALIWMGGLVSITKAKNSGKVEEASATMFFYHDFFFCQNFRQTRCADECAGLSRYNTTTVIYLRRELRFPSVLNNTSWRDCLTRTHNGILSPVHRRLLTPTPTSVASCWDCFNSKQNDGLFP
mmetsp:Transcript_21317/g.26119  ORF Transcript_21317/g.26119 Transcript_21317/m.26119 type:complete len:140 (-) Transcript_21317:117-536(-)